MNTAGFNTEFAQLAMEMVFGERRRQVRLGREGVIPNACEDPATHWGLRLGTLGEEYGEVCKAVIEGQSDQNLLEECIHVAAVALACAESVLRKLDLDPEDLVGKDSKQEYEAASKRVEGRVGVSGGGYHKVVHPQATSGFPIFTGPSPSPISDFFKADFTNSGQTEDYKTQYGEVLEECRRVFKNRDARRGPLWAKMGMRGQLVNMRTCVERLWNELYSISHEELSKRVDTERMNLDDAIDLINYTVFMILCTRMKSRDGQWSW